MSTFAIKERPIGIDHPPFVIAEMSGNHNNSFEHAMAIVHSAAAAGADAIKLQAYTADTITIDSDREEFLIRNPDSLWDGRTLHELDREASTDWDWIRNIMEEAERLNLICFSSVFDESSVDFLEDLNACAYKIASFENNHIPLIRKAASTGKPLIISTGTASEDEVREAAGAARDAGCQQLALLKCTSDYPADPSDSNLRTIPHMRQVFECQIGLSDHTLGIGVAIASVALGATIIEKHFTTDRNLGGVDAAFSANESEMAQLVAEATNAWKSIGEASLDLSEKESQNTQFRRSIYAVADIKAGEPFTAENVRVIRPGFGLHPRHYDQILGIKSHRDFSFGEPLDLPGSE